MGWNCLEKKNNLSPFTDLSIHSDCFLSTSFFPVRALKYGVLVLQLPSPPTDDEGDFIFIHHDDVRLSQKADEVYAQLIKLLKDQHEVAILFFLETFGVFVTFLWGLFIL